MFPLYVSPESIKNFRMGLFISLLYLLLICFFSRGIAVMLLILVKN